MKYIKKYKLFETGEWNSEVDWDYVKDNPDDNCQECDMIKRMAEYMDEIISQLNNESIFNVEDIRGFDMSQGVYARVKIFNKNYKIWVCDAQYDYPDLFIENFPVDNSDEDQLAGYVGSTWFIAKLLNDINKVGGIERYIKIKNYNLK